MRTKRLLMNLRRGVCGEFLPEQFVLEHRLRNGVGHQYRCGFSSFHSSGCGGFRSPRMPSRVGLCSSVNSGCVPNERDGGKSDEDGDEKFDASLARTKFPSIIVGSSPSVDLYDGSSYFPPMASLVFNGYFPDSGDSSWGLPSRLCESWSLFSLSLNEVDAASSLSTEEIVDHSFVDEPEAPVATGGSDDAVVQEEDFGDIVDAETYSSGTLVEFLLDRPINCIPGLSKRQCSQLEKIGFHTEGHRKSFSHFSILSMHKERRINITFYPVVVETVESLPSDICRSSECSCWYP